MAKGDDDADAPVKTPPRNDAYTGMLIISLLAMTIGCVLLYLDYSRYPASKPPGVQTVAPVKMQGEAPPEQPKAEEKKEAEKKAEEK
jgi:hypothetical protein